MIPSRIIDSFKKYFWTYTIGIIFVILANLSRSITPKLVQKMIDGIVSHIHTAQSASETKSQITEFIIYYLGLTLISALFTFLMRQMIIVNSHNISYNLRNEFYQHIQQLKINEYHKYRIGDYMSRMAEDINKIRELFGPALMYLVNLIVSLGMAIYFMNQVNTKLTIYALIPLPFLSISIFIINTFSYKFNKRSQELSASLNSQAQESYNGIRIIKSFTLEKKMGKRFNQLSDDYRSQKLKIVKLESLFFPISSFLIGLSILITLFEGGKMYMDGIITLGNLTEFIMYVQSLMWPVISVGWVANLYQSGMAALDRYEEVMKLNEEDYTIPYEPLQNFDITLEHVNYRYENTGIQAIKDVSFHIKFGEKWQIVGKTGCGKTTLAELLMKLYPNYEGNILFGGKNLKELSLESIRKNISYIPQDVFLFSDTVENNIAFADSKFTHEQVVQAAKDAQINNEIEHFADKYQTLVGERGVTLSGGQKQRISIARALIKPSPVYLFDDCLSAVDVETERNLIAAIEKHNRQNTLIMISHRIFNQLKFDKILVLDQGGIAEFGTKEELLALKGIYYDMYLKQELREAKSH